MTSDQLLVQLEVLPSLIIAAEREFGMPGHKENFAEETFTFKRSIWKVLFRWFILLLCVVLNVSFVGATFSQYARGNPADLAVNAVTGLLVLFFDLIILLPLLFEADSVWILPDKLIVRTLLWQAKLPFEEIQSLFAPLWFNYVIVRSRRAVYLLHRKDLQPFDMLVGKIVEKVGPDKLRT